MYVMFLGGIRKTNIRISKWATKLLKTFSTWDGSGGVVSAADTVVAGPADALDEVVNLNILVEHWFYLEFYYRFVKRQWLGAMQHADVKILNGGLIASIEMFHIPLQKRRKNPWFGNPPSHFSDAKDHLKPFKLYPIEIPLIRCHKLNQIRILMMRCSFSLSRSDSRAIWVK